MAESDEDSTTDTSLEGNQSLPPIEEVYEGDNVEKAREKSARKASYSVNITDKYFIISNHAALGRNAVARLATN